MCQSMTRMKNQLAMFLGDPNFPKLISKDSRGEKLQRYQKLHTASYPRSRQRVALVPLMRDLRKRDCSGGAYSGFAAGARRRWSGSSLVSSKPLALRLPGRAWLYEGGIEYISPPFGEIQWYELTSLWFGDAQSLSPASDGRGSHSQGSLLAKARDYDVSSAGDVERSIEMDSPGGSEQKETKCVVLGSTRSVMLEEGVCYVIFVCAAGRIGGNGGGEKIYERVGAGSVSGKCIIGRPTRVIVQ
ncbi:Putative protein of unknown function [Podospora comata]|uniref:Uncharacterized protein n=1 Tax=Podospora comata TaxID=48703 RepID=A0ABY6S9K7_PODCO|nr:Putative protein of unknown function [Podospora comata]